MLSRVKGTYKHEESNEHQCRFSKLDTEATFSSKLIFSLEKQDAGGVYQVGINIVHEGSTPSCRVVDCG